METLKIWMKVTTRLTLTSPYCHLAKFFKALSTCNSPTAPTRERVYVSEHEYAFEWVLGERVSS